MLVCEMPLEHFLHQSPPPRARPYTLQPTEGCLRLMSPVTPGCPWCSLSLRQFQPPGRACSHPETSEGERQRQRPVHLRPAAQPLGREILRSPAGLGGWVGHARVNFTVGRKTWWSVLSATQVLEPVESKWRMAAQPGFPPAPQRTHEGSVALGTRRAVWRTGLWSHCFTLWCPGGCCGWKKGKENSNARPFSDLISDFGLPTCLAASTLLRGVSILLLSQDSWFRV